MAGSKRADRPPRVIVADHRAPARSGACAVLAASGYAVVGECSNAESLLAAAKARRPNICLVNGASSAGRLPTIAALAALDPPPRVVVVATSTAVDDVLAAFEYGAAGYLLESVPADRLGLHLEDVAEGDLALSPALVAALVRRARSGSAADLGAITHREQEVMRLLSEGLTTKRVAERLGVSPTTVRRHASSAARKLGACDRRTAIRKLGAVHANERG